MATNWISGLIVPLIKATVLIAFFGSIIYFILYYMIKLYRVKLKWFIKYYVFGRDFDKDILAFCAEEIEKDKNYWQVKKKLLINEMPMNDIYDVMYIYKKVSKELKGGVNYGRVIKGYNFKD